MKLSKDYILGIAESKAIFTFSGNGTKKIPAFYFVMEAKDKEMVKEVKLYLGLKNKIYVHDPYKKDGAKRKSSAKIAVRDFNQIKNIIIPFFYNQLKGSKGKEFISWLNKIGKDPAVPKLYKLFYRLHRTGYWKK
ncbi:TPA: hypothetical protein DGT35_00390 [Patescibacteria group bacterium]|jgi:hypothetical protein|nr:hypothetical protein [Patescibacteria group bacterium]|tara:strand:- start:5897 stop:6301 length:405 start_codon:yes stop_codon:yes gene_type:complete